MNLREVPIVLENLAHTGKIDGDDSGYRDVAISPLDLENPDLLVEANSFITCYPVYYKGPEQKICPYYSGGIGGMGQLLVRKPVLGAMLDVNKILQPFGRQLLLLDAYRPAKIQARLWRYQFYLKMGIGVDWTNNLTKSIICAQEADKIGSFVEPVKNDLYWIDFNWHKTDQGPTHQKVTEAAEALGISEEDVIHWIMVIIANDGDDLLVLDSQASTAHGSGGAIDVYMCGTSSGRPSCLGVPYDYPGAASRIDFCEKEENIEELENSRRNDPMLRQYLLEHGIRKISADNFNSMRDERRLLFHAITEASGTFYVHESWHFQFGNERGGNQRTELPGAGNTCHSLLKNVRDQSGNITAAWGNAAAHKLAANLRL